MCCTLCHAELLADGPSSYLPLPPPPPPTPVAPLPQGDTCASVASLFSTSITSLLLLNPALKCTSPIPTGKQVCCSDCQASHGSRAGCDDVVQGRAMPLYAPVLQDL